MIPASGSFSLSDVNLELGRASGAPLTLDDAGLRALTCNAARLPAGSPVSMNDLRGRSGYLVSAYMKDQGSGVVGARQGDGFNPSPVGTFAGVPIREISSGYNYGFPSSFYYFEVRMNVPQPYNRFWGVAIYQGGTLLGLQRYDQMTGREDRYASEGWIAVRHPMPPTSNAFDLRPYVGQTLQFLFVL